MFNKLKKIIAAGCILCAMSIGASASAAELSGWAYSDFINANLAQLIPFSVGARSMCGNITREQLCELIVNTYEKLSGEELPTYPFNPFTDCENQTVIDAYGSGLVGGTSDTTFSPDELVTREEMAKMLHNMLAAAELNVKFSTTDELSDSEFADVDEVSDWARVAMATVISHSLMNGIDGKLVPSGNATREQAIVAVSRAYEAFGDGSGEMNQIIMVTSPSEQDVLAEGDVTVTWNSVYDVDYYRVLIRNSNGELIVNDVVNETSHTIVKSMFEVGAYNVSVEGVMKNGKEIFSVPVGFYYKSSESMFSLVQENSTSPLKFFASNQPVKASESKALTPISSEKAEAVFAEAEKYIGVPYLYGGTTPSGFDCSGFVQYVFKNNGIKLKRTSRDQYASNGYGISKDELQRGDLVFFGTGGTVSHVGIYAGNGQMIHSPSTGKTITYTSIETNYYTTHYIGAKRVL